jgi:hypothetical protein
MVEQHFSLTEQRLKLLAKTLLVSNCYRYMRTGSETSLTVEVVRSPRSHVLSMFMQCAFDEKWGVVTTKGTAFPRSHLRSNFYADFGTWVRFFYTRGEAGTLGPDGDFNCYNPINLQVRQTVCHRPAVRRPVVDFGPHHIFPATHLHPATYNVSAHEAVANLELPHVVVVIAEAYAEGWCVLHYQLTAVLPEYCRLSSAATNKFGCITMGRDELHESHGVPPHSVANVSDAVLKEIDAITAKDAVLYRAAAARFLVEASRVEAETKQTFVCAAVRARLIHASTH